MNNGQGHYDVVVLGGGTAAANAARTCVDAGRSVAMVEDLAFGGTCPLRGCDPKKMLRRGAEVVEAAALMRGKGIRDEGLSVDWKELVTHKNSFTEPMPGKISSSLENKGIDLLRGTAEFVEPHAIVVDGDKIEADRFIIATGSVPRPMDLPGAEHLVTSTMLMDMEELPDRLLFVGAGYVSLEFAHMIARTGREMRLVEMGDRLLPQFDRDLTGLLRERTRQVGIDIVLEADISAVELDGVEFVVRAGEGEDAREWRADLVIHGAGRVPATQRLNLAAAGIETDGYGVAVNEFLQSTSNPAVYAAGDAAASDGKPLTPVAALEGKAAARNLLDGNTEKPDYAGVPSVVFTIPPLAAVGLGEKEARERFDNVRVVDEDTGAWFSNLRIGEECGHVKVIIDEAEDRIVGAHLLGDGYDELINIFGMAIKLGLTTAQIKSVSSAYPTHFSDLGSML